MCASHLSARRSAVIVTAAREGERTGEGDEREGESKWMMEPLWLWSPPPRSSGLCVSSPSKGEDAWGGTRGGKQDERRRRDRKESLSALVVKRKQVMETEEGGLEW